MGYTSYVNEIYPEQPLHGLPLEPMGTFTQKKMYYGGDTFSSLGIRTMSYDTPLPVLEKYRTDIYRVKWERLYPSKREMSVVVIVKPDDDPSNLLGWRARYRG